MNEQQKEQLRKLVETHLAHELSIEAVKAAKVPNGMHLVASDHGALYTVRLSDWSEPRVEPVVK